MWSSDYTYFALMLGSVFFPFVFSFERNVGYYKQWKALGIAIVIPGVFFIVWDALFTKLGFWSFNDQFILGPRLLGLPLEEWLFFVVIPFCSVFIYEVAKFYLHSIDFQKYVRLFFYLLVLVFSVFAVLSFGKWYTFINLASNVVFLIFVLNVSSFQKYLTHFLIAFLVACVPMFIVNGLLTALPVVEYNGTVFSNVRLFDIPIEDFSYFLLLMLMNVFVYEKSKQLMLAKKKQLTL